MEVKMYRMGALSTNCYLLSSGGECALVDPDEYSELVWKYIVSQKLTLKYILLTHGHFDHYLGSGQFAEQSGAKIAIGRLDEEMLYDSGKNCGLMMGMPVTSVVDADILLDGGEVLSLGDEYIRVIATPGHSRGGMSYLCGKYLFSGDCLFQGGIGRTDFYGSDEAELKRTIREKLFVLADDTLVLSGHGAATKIGEEKAHNPYLM